MMVQRSLIASHRGGAFLWPENSLAAFRATVALPVDQAECDVHASADGDPFVIHDATLERTTEGEGAVVSTPSERLASLRVRGCSGETVPGLADFLGVLRGTGVAPRIEVKTAAGGHPYRGLMPKVVGALDDAGLRQVSWIISFNADVTAEALALGGLAGAAWLLDGRTWRALGARGAIAVAAAYGFPEIGLHEAQIDAESLAALRGAGLRASVWGANHEGPIRRMLGLGIDVITTDDPPLALALRG